MEPGEFVLLVAATHSARENEGRKGRTVSSLFSSCPRTGFANVSVVLCVCVSGVRACVLRRERQKTAIEKEMFFEESKTRLVPFSLALRKGI